MQPCLHMSLKKFILPVTLAIAVIGIAVWGYIIFENRYTKNTTPTKESTTIEQTENNGEAKITIDADGNVVADDSNATDSDSEIADLDEDSSTQAEVEEDSFIDITTKDCENNCKNFPDTEDLKYCQNICGLNSKVTENVTKLTDCSDIEDPLEADYCFKDFAIKKNDVKICDNIEDASIKKSCKNRFIEDILDQVPQE